MLEEAAARKSLPRGRSIADGYVGTKILLRDIGPIPTRRETVAHRRHESLIIINLTTPDNRSNARLTTRDQEEKALRAGRDALRSRPL